MAAKPSQRADAGGDQLGRTPLHYAAADGDVSAVRRLLAAGADPAAGDHAGWTPLHFAAQAHSAEACVTLLDAGAPVDAPDANGNTPLFRATFDSRGRGEVIALLRARGADPLRANAHGVSPASLARSVANFEIARHFTDVQDESGDRAG